MKELKKQEKEVLMYYIIRTTCMNSVVIQGLKISY